MGKEWTPGAKPNPYAGAMDTKREAPISAAPVGEVSPKKGLQIPDPPPWIAGHPKLKVQYPARIVERRYLQLQWIAEHTPRLSVQKIMDEALEMWLERWEREQGRET